MIKCVNQKIALSLFVNLESTEEIMIRSPWALRRRRIKKCPIYIIWGHCPLRDRRPKKGGKGNRTGENKIKRSKRQEMRGEKQHKRCMENWFALPDVFTNV